MPNNRREYLLSDRVVDKVIPGYSRMSLDEKRQLTKVLTREPSCLWRYDDTDYRECWITGCGSTINWAPATLQGSGYEYCPGCGKRIALWVGENVGINQQESE